jgi:hypothetical protein
MRKPWLWTAVLLCTVVLVAFRPAGTRRSGAKSDSDAGTTDEATLAGRLVPEPVRTGPGPFPHTIEITGTIDVGNLPLDDEGNLLVSGISCGGGPAPVRFVGVTTQTVSRNPGEFDPEFPVLAMNHACHAEFPATRACTYGELLRLTPPADWQGLALVATNDLSLSNAVGVCLTSQGQPGYCTSPTPTTCCGS